ncbi:MAG: helix-turn-helix transcriptional regulator [Chthoniobacterales bacterium]|nr:helix-turn-helix transcriptional regulator [Chthoniobacterales bacterium]
MATLTRFYSPPPLPGARFRPRAYGLREAMRPGFVNRPQGTGDYLVMLFHDPVRAGCGTDAGWVASRTLHVWGPDDHQFYGHERRRYVHSWMHCEGSAVRQWLHPHLRRPVVLKSTNSFLSFLSTLHNELTAHAVPDEVIAENLFENWVRDLDRELAGGRRPPARLAAVREFLDAHPGHPHSLEALARMAHWSPAHFSEEFRRHFGAAPIAYLIRQRMAHARHLLRDVGLTVADVAQRVGYDDLYHFSKLFKKHCGISPGAVREKGSHDPRKESAGPPVPD